MSATGAPARRIRLALITGLSGSGRSSVAKCLEDLGYYCVDNLPLPLLRDLLTRPDELCEGRDRIAVVADVRTPGFEREFPSVLAGIDTERFDPTLVFLEASDEVLIRRFSETRRPHPLAPDAPPSEGIRRERQLLENLRSRADLVLDTSEWSIHEIRSVIHREFAELGGEGHQMLVSVISFGFKYGIPYGSDLLFDVRFLPNPHFVEGLRERTGLEAPVQDFLDRQADFPDLLDRLGDLLGYLLPRYQRENRSYLSIAVGCTGGRHRSVAVAERLAGTLAEAGWSVRLLHRDVER
ncbi:MAG: RNase adapter RapZ [Thermoanaerobaculia bacterium]|nr:RNase adapter RapZ [Thermoanaerobaculia bacterium]MCZ7650825.1 RNase adapter RapZ [Thermoanaerobaculia bacterium]